MGINSHIHSFDKNCIPNGFLPFGLVRLGRSKTGGAILGFILRNANPFNDNDSLDRVDRYMSVQMLKSQKEIIDICKKNYKGWSFVVLTVDMTFMGAGKVPKSFFVQCSELSYIAEEDKSIIPFLHLDPRRDNLDKYWKEFIVLGNFKGIKLYTSMGYFPYDEKLKPYFVDANRRGLSVIAHCTPGNPVHFMGRKKKLKEMLGDKYDRKLSKKDNCSKFTHPINYIELIERYQNINWCFAHWGGAVEWDKYFENPNDESNWFSILKMFMRVYPNVYVDISFTLSNKKYIPLLKILCQDESINNKILFGSDFSMNQTEGSENIWSINLRATLGEEVWNKITFHNTRNFLR